MWQDVTSFNLLWPQLTSCEPSYLHVTSAALLWPQLSVLCDLIQSHMTPVELLWPYPTSYDLMLPQLTSFDLSHPHRTSAALLWPQPSILLWSKLISYALSWTLYADPYSKYNTDPDPDPYSKYGSWSGSGGSWIRIQYGSGSTTLLSTLPIWTITF